jgi:DNA-binding MarR family transcriptional regulator
MDSKGRIDRDAFNARVADVVNHPRFAEAKRRLCRDVPDSRLHRYFRHTLDADAGAFGLGIAIVGLNHFDKVNGASMETVIFALEKGGIASATRVRAMVDILEHQGMLQVLPNEHDKRRKKLVFTEPYMEAQRHWFEALLGATALVFDLPGTPHELAFAPTMLERYINGVMLRNFVDGFTIFEGMPDIEAFMLRKHGFLLMLELAAADGLEADIDRSGMAERFDVSRAHIATMLHDAEAHGWLKRNPPSSRIDLDPAFRRSLDLFVSREMTIVGLWFEARRDQLAASLSAARQKQ